MGALLLCNIVSIIAVSGAVYLAATGKEGWGWCLFVACICHTTGKISN